ncbi:MAG TPA: NfeD family protein [Usitatibacter sp.]|nr:NfeD family protein [Usitatibacter sp.]
MELWLLWLIAGFVLVIAELFTGTFYLLVIGLGAFAGGVASWTGAHVMVQAVAAAAVAIAGAWAVHHWHERQPRSPEGDNLLDRGQPVVLEGWSNEAAGLARVRYRGSSWDARLALRDERPPLGATLYISGQQGNELVVASAPPS